MELLIFGYILIVIAAYILEKNYLCKVLPVSYLKKHSIKIAVVNIIFALFGPFTIISVIIVGNERKNSWIKNANK